MVWYTTGTVAVTNASPTVTGTGTAFVANALAGDAFRGPDGVIYEIISVDSNLQLTISPNYGGATAAGQAYRIVPTQGRLVTLSQAVNALIADYSAIALGIGSGNMPDGSAAAPGMRFGADADTGLFRSGANVLGLSTGGVLRASVSTTALTAAVPVLAPNGAAATPAFSFSGDPDTGLFWAAANELAIATGGAERVRVGATGLVGVGTTAPGYTLDVQGAFGAVIARLKAAGSSYSGIVIAGDANGGWLGNSAQQTGEGIYYQNAINAMRVYANGAERLRLEAAGAIRPGADNAQTLGTSGSRWSVVYAGTGTINTSDENDKLWRGGLDAAELRAARRIAAELGFYQWLAKIDEIGAENARFHFGVRAQVVWSIMADEGLVDPLDTNGRPGRTPYAFLCWDDWEEETAPAMADVEIPAVFDSQGNELAPARIETQPTGEMEVVREAGSRFGIRPDQLALFLIAAQEARLVALEAIIAPSE